jgi:hypothetical protein
MVPLAIFSNRCSGSSDDWRRDPTTRAGRVNDEGDEEKMNGAAFVYVRFDRCDDFEEDEEADGEDKDEVDEGEV